VFFGDVNESTVRVLAAEGCSVEAPAAQGCCGALALHAGQREDAGQFARRLIAVFEGLEVDQIVVNAAGCGSTLKEYGELLKHDAEWAARARAFSARVRDFSETLDGLASARAPRRPLPLRVAYHDACHLAHAQGIREAPRRLLAAIPGITLVPLADSEICCGSAGIFNLVQPDMAAELGRTPRRRRPRRGGHLEPGLSAADSSRRPRRRAPLAGRAPRDAARRGDQGRVGQVGRVGRVGQRNQERLRPSRAEAMRRRGEGSASVRAGGGAPGAS
jgi:hypothetical protein